MAPEVFYTVCYNTKSVPEAISALHTFTPAVLHGYSRRRVRNCDYPGIIPDDDTATVLGTLVTGLTKANIHKLDDFEGSEYERRKVKVKVLKEVGNAKGEGNVETGEEREVDTYVFLYSDELEDKEWDFEEFRREKMANWTRGGLWFSDDDRE
ncbi:hypothetical protein V8F20_009627 [Naviculisporaceae sp. PSN 640]